MRVMGIDPGSRLCGWGIVERQGSRVVHVASTTVVLRGEHLADKLVQLAHALQAAVETHAPHAVAVESIFHAKNSASALTLGHARGAAVLALAQRGLVPAEYTPGQIKQAVTGHGRADKEQVASMVRLLLGPHVAPKMGLDESDALAAAICHAYALR